MGFCKNIMGQIIKNRLIVHKCDGVSIWYTNNIKDFNYINGAIKRGYNLDISEKSISSKIIKNLDPIFDALIYVNNKITKN